MKTALTIREWIDGWIQPIHRIVSIATGKSRDLTYVATRTPTDKQSTWRGQVFGTGITQKPYESVQAQVRDMASALMLKADNVSLLALVRAWQWLDGNRHPLIETYGPMLMSHDQHPRSRFLLLVQAMEGHHGHETRQQYESRRQQHQQQRAALITATEKHLNADAMKFLKRNLRKEPPTSLDEALVALISDLPVDVLPLLDTAGLVKAVKEDDPNSKTTVRAVRVVRNNLAHGLRGYDPHDLLAVVQILDRVIRAHALRLLGCPEIVQERALQSDR